MKAWLSVFIGRYQPDANNFVYPVNGNQHGFGRQGGRVARAAHYLTCSDTADEGDCCHANLVICSEVLDAMRDAVAVLKPENEYPAELTF